MSGTTRWLGTVCTAIAAWLAGAASAQDVDFHRDIAPIFAEHCYECHGPDRVEAGLSLYTLAGAMAGGDSGAPILGGTVDTNEILRRINHDDPEERMPLEAPPLSQEQIGQLTRWVEQGTPWDEPDEAGPADEATGVEGAIKTWVTPYWPLLLGLLIAVVVIERVKAIAAKREAGEGEGLSGLQRVAQRVTPAIYLIALLCLVVGVLVDRVVRMSGQLDEVLAEPVDEIESAAVEFVFGNPPMPMHPGHEPRIGGTYYRGNCERDEQLFNGGNYRTATFELSLINEQGQPLDYGDDASGPLRVRLVIEKAPNSEPALFSQGIMEGLFLTAQYFESEVELPLSEQALFTIDDGPDRWQAEFPLPGIGGEATGVIYLLRAKRLDAEVLSPRGLPHAGIVYDLRLEDGRIAEGSELWMDALFFTDPVIPPTAADRVVPWREWFHYEPIPVIEGENTDDPELLGIPEHLNAQDEPE